MAVTTPNMSIYIPSAGETNYDASFSAGMFNIDQHDHSGGPNNGVPIASSGIDDGAITYKKLAADVADNLTGIGTNGSAGANQLALLGLMKSIYQLQLSGPTAGFISKDGTDAHARTLTSADPTNGINISNGNGVGGDPVFSLPVLATYTPVLSFGGGSTGITYQANGQIGKYWRFGNMVYFNITLALSNKGSSTGNASITLPPISSANDNVFQSCSVQAYLGTYPTSGPDSATYITGEIPPNSGSINIVGCGANVQTGVTDASFLNTSELQISGFYWTT